MILEIFHVWVYHHHALLSRKMVTVHICMAFLLRLLQFIFIFQENSPTECHLWGISRFVNFLRSISSKLQDTSLQISCWDDLGWECFFTEKSFFYGYAVEIIIIIVVVVVPAQNHHHPLTVIGFERGDKEGASDWHFLPNLFWLPWFCGDDHDGDVDDNGHCDFSLQTALEANRRRIHPLPPCREYEEAKLVRIKIQTDS